jgi:hypothetical protein
LETDRRARILEDDLVLLADNEHSSGMAALLADRGLATAASSRQKVIVCFG